MNARTTRSRTAANLAGLALAAAALAAAPAMLGCETTAGAGRDLENLGDNIEDAAEDAKKAWPVHNAPAD